MATQQSTRKRLHDWFPIAQQEVALLHPLVDPSTLEEDLWKMLTSVYQELGEMAEEQRQETGNWCEQGCGLCCLETPVVSLIECSFIAQYLEGLPPIQRNAFTQRMDNWLRQPPRSAEKHQAGKCSFLDPAKLCAIYPARPFTCRAYGVIQSMDRFCPAWQKAQKEGGHPVIAGDLADASYHQMATVLALVKNHLPPYDHAMFVPAGVAIALNRGMLSAEEMELLGWDRRKLVYFSSPPVT